MVSKSSRKSIWNSTWMYVLVGTLLVISAILFFSLTGPMELFTAGPKPSLEYFYLENCPHCKDFSPIWDAAVKKMNSDASIANKIDMKKHNINDDKNGGSKRAEKYGIQSAPTVLYIYGPGPKEYTDYDGPRTADAILAFVKAKIVTAS